jgi:hypothetical protein
MLVPVYQRKDDISTLYLFYASINKTKHWFISAYLPGYQPLSALGNYYSNNNVHSNLIISGFKGNAELNTIYSGVLQSTDYWIFCSNSSDLYPQNCSTISTDEVVANAGNLWKNPPYTSKAT